MRTFFKAPFCPGVVYAHTTGLFFCTQMTQMQAARISQILHAKNPNNLCCLHLCHLCAFENVQ
jgi:hypothetical protein